MKNFGNKKMEIFHFIKNYGKRESVGSPIGAPKIVFLWIVLLLGLLIGCQTSDDDEPQLEPYQSELDQLKAAMEPYKDFDKAVADGYDIDATGYRTGMGHHYVKLDLVDGSFDLLQPENLLYVPDKDGKMQFVAVEYVVPIADMDHPQPAPEGFTGSRDVWAINTEFNMWTLHAWIEMDNPNGVFDPMNPGIPEIKENKVKLLRQDPGRTLPPIQRHPPKVPGSPE
ncbi:hypothetical protein K8352_06225 [Flavobacteriaceae bacterium F89]|uniref:Uncharacterized protein n=1 Tax=Cerina litoralis TaxID=2874477 RepID=A0AAE3JS80_9FLAO|nr:hypothetical protein [Cerina litoralis]MCG2460337.1 hypothetical protein [Cerina litoralis]